MHINYHINTNHSVTALGDVLLFFRKSQRLSCQCLSWWGRTALHHPPLPPRIRLPCSFQSIYVYREAEVRQSNVHADTRKTHTKERERETSRADDNGVRCNETKCVCVCGSVRGELVFCFQVFLSGISLKCSCLLSSHAGSQAVCVCVCVCLCV